MPSRAKSLSMQAIAMSTNSGSPPCISSTPLRDNIGLGKKKRGGFDYIFDTFTAGKDKPGSKLSLSFDRGTYEQRGPAVQSLV